MRAQRRAAVLAALLVALNTYGSPVRAGEQTTAQCTPTATLVPLSGLQEASGLAVSGHSPNRLWTHNDSGQPVLFALNGDGSIAGQVRVDGARVEDWEGLAIGPCGSGPCVYIGDIGDNNASRRHITIYRLPEPKEATGSVSVSDVFHATYPDGAQDAEAILLAGGRLYVVTKGETGPVAVYRFPAELQPGGTMRLERVGQIGPKADASSRITDGSVSPDGQWVLLRSRPALTFYRASDFLAGQWRVQSTVDLTTLQEPQGEGVAFGKDTVFLAGEGGGKGRPGTFARFACSPTHDREVATRRAGARTSALQDFGTSGPGRARATLTIDAIATGPARNDHRL